MPVGRWHLSGFLLCSNVRSLVAAAAAAREFKTSVKDNVGVLEALNSMDEGRLQADSSSYAALLRRCKALSEGKHVHGHINRNGYDKNMFVANLLVQMYGNCGDLEDACDVFDRMPQRNLFSWNIMLAAYVQNGSLQGARSAFDRMPEQDVVSWNVMITAYAQAGHLQEARSMFDRTPVQNVVSWNAIIQAYIQHDFLADAKDIFQEMPQRDVVSWNAMVQGYGQAGHLGEATGLFEKMPQQDVVSWTALVTAYAHHRHLKAARCAFINMPQRNVVAWNAMIQAYAQHGDLQDAKSMLHKMPQNDVVSWTVMIAAYADNGLLGDANEMFETMPQPTVISWNAMIAAYAANGHLQDAKSTFDRMPQRNTVSWNAMVQGYAQNGCVEAAVSTFEKMSEHDVISWTTMVAAYAQDGHLQDAKSMFDRMPQRNLVSWNAITAAYVQNGHSKAALQLFRLMDLDGMKPNEVSYVVAFDACANLAALAEGKLIQANIARHELQPAVVVGNAIVNMYGKCGHLQEARVIFDKMPERDVVSWNTLLAAYAQNGQATDAIELFQLMNLDGTKQDSITFLSILSACSHSGLTHDSRQYFHSLARDYSFSPTMEHYMCMTDLLCRAGRLREAEELINAMPFEPNIVSWTTLLSACKSHGDVKRGKQAAQRLIQFNPDNPAPYIQLSGIHAAADRDRESDELPGENSAGGFSSSCSLESVPLC